MRYKWEKEGEIQNRVIPHTLRAFEICAIMEIPHIVVHPLPSAALSGLSEEEAREKQIDYYRTLEKDEDGIAYLEISEARQFVLDGTVIITDENGEPFRFIFNENDLTYISQTENDILTLYTCHNYFLGPTPDRLAVICDLTEAIYFKAEE